MDVINTFYGFYTDVPGRKVVMTFGSGTWTPNHVNALMEDVLKVGKRFGGKWAYIADPRGIDAMIPEEVSQEFIHMHKRVAEEGCAAIAFLDSNTTAMKLMSQMHQDSSDSGLSVGHFDTEKEALEWLRGMGF